MPKKKIFKKENSEKFLLLRGNSQAVNADGKTLENILVPVSKNYKPGTSLLMSNIATLASIEADDEVIIEEDEDIEGIYDDASCGDHSDAAENVVENLLSDMKKLKFSRKIEKFDDDDDFDEEEVKYDDEDKTHSKWGDSRNVENCSENWKMFNEKFDKVLEEYEDSEIGSLEDDMDIGGMRMTSQKLFTSDTDDHCQEAEFVFGDCDEELKEKILNYAEDSGDEKIVEIVTQKPLEFDCESILSICSNKYNHPTVIKEEKTRRSRNTSHTSHNDSESDDKTNCEVLSNTCNIRKRGETPEERKERQRRFKEVKKIRRELKKQNKEAFREEKKLQSMKDQQNASMKLL